MNWFAQMTTFMLMIFIMNNFINAKKSSSSIVFITIMMIMMVCYLLYTMTKKSWMSISLFLTTVGGLMILFTLVASIYPKTISSSIKYNSFILIMLPFLMYYSFMDLSTISNYVKTFQMKISLIFLIILTLNVMLIFISKMIISPMKPFRSLGTWRIYLSWYDKMEWPHSLMTFMWHISISFIIAIILMTIMFSIKTKHFLNFNSSKNIECGFNSMGMKKFSFSNQFFMVSVLFVMFDMELIAILPIPLIDLSIPLTLMITSTMIILSFSILMEWLNGLIEWTKS